MALWCSRLARQPVTLEVDGSSPFGVAICGCSSSGRAPPCQGGGSEFEPRHPLHKKKKQMLTHLLFLFIPQVTMARRYKSDLPVAGQRPVRKLVDPLSFLCVCAEKRCKRASSHRRCKLHIPRPDTSVRSRPFRCTSSPNGTRFAGLPFGFIF